MKYKYLILITTLLAFPLQSFANTAETVNNLLKKGDFASALTAANEGLQSNVDNRQILLQKGFILIKLRQLDEAESFYQALLEKLPDDPEPMNNLGVVYQLKQEYGKAVNQLNLTIKNFPDFARAYENLGDTYIQIAAASYLNGRDRARNDRMLVSKSDLSQRFYNLALDNAEGALQRYTATANSANATATATPAKVTNVEQQVADFLRSWVAAWSGQQPEAYFSHYADDFVPGDNLSLAAWKDRKKRILQAAEFIKIRVEGINLADQTDDKLSLSFTQSYESNTYKSQSVKTLTLGRYDGNWLILKEK